MSGRHVAVDPTGQIVRPAAGVDSLVDPGGPEPADIVLLWDAGDTDAEGAPWLVPGPYGWWWSPGAEEGPPGISWLWGENGDQAGALGLIVVAATRTDTGARNPGRHHASVPPAPTHGYAVFEVYQAVVRVRLRALQGLAAGPVAALVDPVEPTPVTCDDCHGDGCEDCHNRGTLPDLAESDVDPGPDTDTTVDGLTVPPGACAGCVHGWWHQCETPS